MTISGTNATMTNLGTLSQTGTGRGIFDSASTGLLVNNGSVANSTALMQTADADVVRVNVGGVTLNNYGMLKSLNASAGGSQAVDFNPITSGSSAINNFATGTMQAQDADAIRSGVNTVVFNAGLIKSTIVTTTGTNNGLSSDGIDAQSNTGLQVTNDTTGIIDGGRHGITGGAATNLVTFTTSVTNNAGGLIKGNNGSGINLDGFNALQSATIINNGTITGNGVTGDGDGVDSDGLVNLTNTGIIRSINAVSSTTVAQSEGISVGGGTIINSGIIEGLVAAGNTNAVGRGISLLGNDITGGPLAGTREAIYGNAGVTNQAGGLISGDSDSGIAVDGPASDFTVTINNNAGATIQGGGTANAAIRTGADNDTLTNGGTINGSVSGKAIDMGAGNNTLNIIGGTASILGSINGGTGGTNTMNITLGAGNMFSYSGAITNFTDTNVQNGRFNLSGSTTTMNVNITGGTFNYTGAGTLGSNISINGGEFKSNGGSLTGTLTLNSGTVSGTNFAGIALSIGANQAISPGSSPGMLLSGSETWAGGGSYLWEINRLLADGGAQGTDPGWDFANIAGSLTITANSGNKFHINIDSLSLLASWNSNQNYTFNLATASGGIFGFDASGFLIDTSAFDDMHPLGGGSFTVVQNGNDLQLEFVAVPEPATMGFGIALMGLAFARRRRARAVRA